MLNSFQSIDIAWDALRTVLIAQILSITVHLNWTDSYGVEFGDQKKNHHIWILYLIIKHFTGTIMIHAFKCNSNESWSWICNDHCNFVSKKNEYLNVTGSEVRNLSTE